MGIEFEAFLVPADRTLRPEPDAIMRLIEALRGAGFVPPETSIDGDGWQDDVLSKEALETGAIVRKPTIALPFRNTAESLAAIRDGVIVWSVGDHLKRGVREAVTPSASANDEEEYGSYFDVKIWLADDFISNANEMIEGLQGHCDCGADLSYEDSFLYATRIGRTCPTCKAEFRPQDHVTTFRDPFTGAPSALPGGLTFRFAISIDCGKCFDHSDEVSPALSSEFVDICQRALSAEMVQIPYFY